MILSILCSIYHAVKSYVISNVVKPRPGVEDGDKFVRRHNQSKCADQSLILNFAMHSVRMEACDCPPTHHAQSEEQSNSSEVLPGLFECRAEAGLGSSDYPAQGVRSQFFEQEDDIAQKEGFNCPDYTHVNQGNFFWGSKTNKRSNGHDSVKKASQVGEKLRYSVQESEKYRRVGNDGFSRVLFWQFHNFRMLLGSDLLLFSNEKYAAVSLHLWDVTRQVSRKLFCSALL